MSGPDFSGEPLDPFLVAAAVPGQSLARLEARAAACGGAPDIGRLHHDAWRHGVDAALACNLAALRACSDGRLQQLVSPRVLRGRQGITHRARHSSPEQLASAPTATDRAVPGGTATEGARTKAARCPGCEAAADRVVSWRALRDSECCFLPAGTMPLDLSKVRKVAIRAFLHWEQRTKQVAEWLASGGLSPAILLKGGALRYQVYPEPWLRATADLDLLVAPDALEEALQILVDRGATVHLPVPERSWSMRYGHHVTLWLDGFHVELHRSVDQNDRPMLGFEALAATAIPASSLDGSLLLPSLPSQLLVAAAHALKHGLNVPLKSLVDVHLLVEHGALDDACETVRLARSEKLDGILGYLLSSASDLFGTKVPGEALSALRPPLTRRLLLQALLSPWREGFFLPVLGKDTPVRRLLAHVLLVADTAFVLDVGRRFLTRRMSDIIQRRA